MRILALGDSYTAGEGVSAPHSWPLLLAERLVAGGRPAEIRVLAATGWTAAEAHAALLARRPAPAFDAVTIQVGVNDQYRSGAPESYRADLEALLADVVALVGGSPGRIVVVSIPDWSVTPHSEGRDATAASAAIDAHNAAAREAAAAIGARWADVTQISRLAAADPALLAPDGLHPSRAMYERWVPVILAEVCAIPERLPRGGAPA